MFETRSELEQLLAVADEGRIVAAAERLSMTQPALTRAIAKLERRAGGALFERLPTGVRLTALGTVAVGRARRLARELADTDEHIGETIAGRGARLRVSAAPLWMRAVVAPAALRFQRECPGVALTLRSAAFAEGVRLLADGAGDLHWGGIDDGRALPAFLRREPMLRITAGIVAHRGLRSGIRARMRRGPRGAAASFPALADVAAGAGPGADAGPWQRNDAPRGHAVRVRRLDNLEANTGLELDVHATRREAAGGATPPDHSLLLRGAMRW